MWWVVVLCCWLDRWGVECWELSSEFRLGHSTDVPRLIGLIWLTGLNNQTPVSYVAQSSMTRETRVNFQNCDCCDVHTALREHTTRDWITWNAELSFTTNECFPMIPLLPSSPKYKNVSCQDRHTVSYRGIGDNSIYIKNEERIHRTEQHVQ